MSLEQALVTAIGEIPTRRWGLFGSLEVSKARAFARSGNFAVHLSPSETEAWLMAASKGELIRASACVGADPRPIAHPADQAACAKLSRYNLAAAMALVAEQDLKQAPAVLFQPLWTAFPWNQREEAAAWAAGGNLALLTQDEDRWMLGPPAVLDQLPKLLGLRKMATQDGGIGWLKLSKGALWREAFELCSLDTGSRPPAVDLKAKLGVVGIRELGRLPSYVKPQQVWDRLCMRIAALIETIRPARIHVGGNPWTDAAVLWVIQSTGWGRRLHLNLSAPWDLEEGRFQTADTDAYIARVKAQSGFRGGAEAEAFARRIFSKRDPGARLNDQHQSFSSQVGFDSLGAITEAIDRSIESRAVTYSVHSTLSEQSVAVARGSNRLIVGCFSRDDLPAHAVKATQYCVGQHMFVPVADLAGIGWQAPQ